MDNAIKSQSLRFLLIFCTLFVTSSLSAIECKKAKTENEKIICGNESLKNYDAALSKVYTAILSSLKEDEKQKLSLNQNEWLNNREKLKEVSDIQKYYIERIRAECKTYENVCKSLSDDIIEKEQGTEKLKEVDSIIIASYLKSNLTSYIDDKPALSDIEDDIKMNDNMNSLDYVDLHKLNDKNILVTVPLFMGAYQGQSMSYVYNNKAFKVVRFPKFDETLGKLIFPFTHSNYADWVKSKLMIHDRSQGYLYECGSTEYYLFEKDAFKLIKQTSTFCSEKELDEISKGTLTPDDIKIITVYPKQMD